MEAGKVQDKPATLGSQKERLGQRRMGMCPKYRNVTLKDLSLGRLETVSFKINDSGGSQPTE